MNPENRRILLLSTNEASERAVGALDGITGDTRAMRFLGLGREF